MILAGIGGALLALALCGVMLRDVARSRAELTYLEQVILPAERRTRPQRHPTPIEEWAEAVRVGIIVPMAEAYNEIERQMVAAWEPFREHLAALGLIPKESP